MVIAHLVVGGAPDPDDNKLWGEYSFLALPRAGERIEVPHDGIMECLLVETVEHRPTPHPVPENQTLLGREAQAFVYARWQSG
jgi:hypothetical protein